MPKQPPTKPKPRLGVLLLAAGSGSRAGGDVPKQYQMLEGQPVLAHSLQAFIDCADWGVALDFGVLVLAPDDAYAKNALSQLSLGVFQPYFVGGASRAQSTAGGLRVLQEAGMQPQDWVLVHDAARCLIAPKAIVSLIHACFDDAVGGLLAQPVGDTLKQGQSGRVQKTIERTNKWQAQTPQMFRLGLLQQALHKPIEQITDEASAVEALGLQPQLVANDSINLKLTYPQDFALAQALLRQRAQTQSSNQATTNNNSSGDVAGPLRIGEGFDVHALIDAAASGRQLILGGVLIPFDKALQGHSDADVLLHAITDAVLGAAGLGDIGRHFPDTDLAHLGADSKKLLQTACVSVRKAGFAIVNVDATIIAQQPKLVAHMDAMVASVAGCLGVAPTQVNIKAKTAEKLGPVGEGLSMEARAVALLQGTSRSVT